MKNATLVEIQSPPQLMDREKILSAVDFPTENLVSATWMNRVQNEAYFHLCDVSVYSCKTVCTLLVLATRRKKSNYYNKLSSSY